MAPEVTCLVCARTFPPGTFLLAELSSDGEVLHVDGPELTFAHFAGLLTTAVGNGELSRQAAVALLAAYGMELCGSYARDPARPYGGPCAYRLPPATTPERLRSWLGQTRHLKGRALAQVAVRMVRGGAASPMECLHVVMLSLPARHGGFGLGVPLMNAQLVTTQEVSALLGRTSLRPDLLFEDLGLAIEHNGAVWHEGVDRVAEDARRAQCYAALGIRCFPSTAQDVESFERYEGFLRRLAHCIGHDRGRSCRDELLRRMGDPASRAARLEVFSALRGCGRFGF